MSEDVKDLGETASAPKTPAEGGQSRSARRPHGLGRGLSALLGEVAQEESIATAAQGNAHNRSVQPIDISSISPHPGQPRRHFDEGALQELADSIARRGVIQPIVVRPFQGGYQIVAGERRWRAAQRAQLHRIPAIVREFNDAETLEVALVENIQRQDLNPLEEAQAYSRLIAEYGHSQEALGRLVGKSRSHVANLIRLLDLPTGVQQLVRDGQITMGHARALIGMEDAEALAHEIIAKGLSVRHVEALVQKAGKGRNRAGGSAATGVAVAKDADIEAIERHLADILGLKVQIGFTKAGSGTVTLHYSTLDQLDMLCQRLSGEPI